MTKINKLHQWLLAHGDWVYLAEVPCHEFGMSLASCSSALIALVNTRRADYRIVRLKQYRGKPGPHHSASQKITEQSNANNPEQNTRPQSL